MINTQNTFYIYIHISALYSNITAFITALTLVDVTLENVYMYTTRFCNNTYFAFTVRYNFVLLMNLEWDSV